MSKNKTRKVYRYGGTMPENIRVYHGSRGKKFKYIGKKSAIPELMPKNMTERDWKNLSHFYKTTYKNS